ncbi:hypothetical protein B9Z55_027695 [Caenorhabditis nigoni]|uniref:Uncharacterized protein n=1 Tax=Caenorhabditis nigoni TaxID=1611254 RepID=A0A2G5SEU0_9PELO|nr:hypothetical protein B9Z55_027695 [Caenorhabditis nigoni]
MITDYFTEINADAQEKLVIDGDEESVTESNGNSQRREDTWSSASESRRPAVTEGFEVPVLPTNVAPHEKRASPLPPQEANCEQESLFKCKEFCARYNYGESEPTSVESAFPQLRHFSPSDPSSSLEESVNR